MVLVWRRCRLAGGTVGGLPDLLLLLGAASVHLTGSINHKPLAPGRPGRPGGCRGRWGAGGGEAVVEGAGVGIVREGEAGRQLEGRLGPGPGPGGRASPQVCRLGDRLMVGAGRREEAPLEER